MLLSLPLSHVLLSLSSTIVIVLFVSIWFTGYQSRKIVNRLHKQEKPMPQFNWIFGHLLVIKKFLDLVPPDAVFNYTALKIARQFPEHHMFYLDFWPFTTPVLVVANPFPANQIMQHPKATKPENVRIAFKQMTGGPNLLTMPEDDWKRWRSIFTPGFSPTYMLEQVPLLVEQGEIFCNRLRKSAEASQIIQLEEATFRLAIDVIAELGLDIKLEYQTRSSPFADTLRSLIEIVTFGQDTNPFIRWNPIRPFKVWYYGRRLDSFVYKELEKRFAERRLSLELTHAEHMPNRKKKSIVALALDTYVAEHVKMETDIMNEVFKRYAASQLRLFLVAGHDTTSSALTYTIHLLHRHQDFLARVRAEHDTVFGADTAATPTILANNPNLLNQLPLTLAAIKETLRLFPPAGGIRMGHPDITLTAEDGMQFPTANCAVWVVHEALHRNPAYWPDPDSYIPERWLVHPEHPLYPQKGAWRAFEIGPHNCIGQTLAVTEIKTVLVMTLRKFDIQDAYAEWDRLNPKRGINRALGERAYQVSGGGGGQHPADRYPCRVFVRNSKL